ncbi:MAG: hypothetical protein IPK57_17580 [Chitinophagaceae bacterium]|nr:hypothetical protein [Chitinophagaceae bacterium]
MNTVYINPGGGIEYRHLSVATGYKVNIGGKVMCEELKSTTTPMGRLCFADNYKLMNLSQLERFIKRINICQTYLLLLKWKKWTGSWGICSRMMEKIEELTLYIIELKKEIDTLKEQKNRT